MCHHTQTTKFRGLLRILVVVVALQLSLDHTLVSVRSADQHMDLSRCPHLGQPTPVLDMEVVLTETLTEVVRILEPVVAALLEEVMHSNIQLGITPILATPTH